MTKFILKYIFWFLLLIPAQAVVFDRMILFDVAVPEVFIFLIIMLPVTIGTNISTLAGFLAGFCLDIFCDTPGVNALSCTILAFSRKSIFHLYVSMDDDLAGKSPSSRAMGASVYMKYLLTMVLIYCSLVFTIEAFQFFNFRLLVVRILASTAYTFILLYAGDCMRSGPAEAKV